MRCASRVSWSVSAGLPLQASSHPDKMLVDVPLVSLAQSFFQRFLQALSPEDLAGDDLLKSGVFSLQFLRFFQNLFFHIIDSTGRGVLSLYFAESFAL
jgi:hypothetical protein